MEFCKERILRLKNRSIRNESVSRNPQEDLITYLDRNNVVEILKIIGENRNVINEPFDYPYFRPILNIALLDKASTTSTDVIEALIALGAQLDYINEFWNEDGEHAIHFAALGGNPHLLKCIIKYIGIKGINSTTNDGNTSLVLLIKDGNAENPNFIDCVQVLVDNNININKTNNKNASAIYWAAKKKYKNVIDILLKFNDIDLDSVTCNETARELLLSMDVDVSHIPIYCGYENEPPKQLLIYLKSDKELNFIELASRIGIDDENINELTYLQMACSKHLLEVVLFLLSKKVDVNKSSIMNALPPIEIAAEYGYHNIFKVLVEYPSTIVENRVLSNLLRDIDKESSEQVNYYLCYEYLMKHRLRHKINLNIKDEKGNYPLHYSTKYGGPEVALSLLNSKASLANRNNTGILTIAEVDYDILKEHLDSCIEVTCTNSEKGKAYMDISFDYTTLLPTVEKREITPTSINEEEKFLSNEEHNLVLETEAVSFMSSSMELKPLLKHPVISSFLYMKWYLIRWIYFTNLLFYLTLCVALLLHSRALYNFTNYEGFSYYFLLLALLFLFVREFFQIIIAPFKYIQYIENYIIILLMVVVILMLLLKPPYSDKTVNQLCPFGFLLAAFELLFLLGNYPSFSTNIVMLRTVSLNFFKFLLFFSILLIAFAFSFHVLFNDSISSSSPLLTNSTETEHPRRIFSENLFVSMFRTFIMLTGEFNSDNIHFEQYPLTSHFIFLLFVITIVIIILNLALSDTQEIRNEAELVGQIVRAQYLSYAESTIFSFYNLFNCKRQNKNKRSVTSKSFAERICLFPNYLKDYKLTVYPNKNGRVQFENKENSKWGFQNVNLDKKCIQKARIIIQEKKEKDKRKKEDNIQHDKINEIRNILHSIDVKIRNRGYRSRETT